MPYLAEYTGLFWYNGPMQTAAPPLPEDLETLRRHAAEQAARLLEYERQVAGQEQQIQDQDRHIEQLLDYIQLLRHKRFGRRADAVSKDQLNLFDEAELEALIGDLETEVEQGSAGKRTRKPKPGGQARRRPLPPHLRRVERLIDLSAAEKQAMGAGWVLIGYDVSEQLAVIPRQHYVIHYKRAKYAPVDDTVDGAGQGIKIAPRPSQIIPKSIAHSSVIADVVVAKFVDGLPLYRQEKIFAREGIEISRQSMSGWIVQLHERLTPLTQVLKELFYAGRVVHIDETPLQVLNEPGREDTQKSWMWVYRGGPPDQPVVWFQYAPSRGGEVPREFLFPDEPDPPPRQCYIVTDDYGGYDALARLPGVLGHAACWAHVRRKFVEATQGRKKSAAAHQMVALIGKLYHIERKARGESPAQRHALRQEYSRPVLDKIKAWLDDKAPKVLPKGLLGKAIRYTINLWPQLTTFLEDGHIGIDNNPAENAIRPFVIGRKNFLFSGSPRGAAASATLYTLIETAKACGLEPRAYLGYLFEKLPTARTPEALRALLPHHLKTEDLVL